MSTPSSGLRLCDCLAAYRGKKVLVTGHTGFKGSWLCWMLADAGAQVCGYSLEPPTQPNLFELSGIGERVESHIGDIRDLEHLQHMFEQFQPEIVLHLAAQPIVRDSYDAPRYTYETNVMGTVNVLECVRACPSVKSFLNVTTDKVYLNEEREGYGYREDDPLDGFDPYSNSKSCSELVTHSYAASFFNGANAPAISTARAGNVIGGGDFANSRIIPDCVRAAQAGSEVVIRNPYSTRPFQHVLEPLAAYLMIAAAQLNDESKAGWYNVGPDDCDCVSAGELADLWCDAWPGATWSTPAEKAADGKHEANFLKLDSSKLKRTFGWQPTWGIADAVAHTAAWTRVWLEGGNIGAEMTREIQEFMQ